MTFFTIYVTATGQIVQAGACQAEAASLLAADVGETLLTSETDVYSLDQMIVNGAPVARPQLSSVATWDTLAVPADGVSKATLGPGLPNPTAILISPPKGRGIGAIPVQVAIDGSFRFATSVPGDYVITVNEFPYMDYEVTINAT